MSRPKRGHPLTGPKPKTEVGPDANDRRIKEGAARELKKESKSFVKSFNANTLVAITGVFVLLTYIGQLIVMRGTLDEMKRTFIQGNRAYMGVQDTILWVWVRAENQKEKSGWKKIEAAGGKLTNSYSFEVVLRNSGNTPAIGVDGAYMPQLLSDLPSDNTMWPEGQKIDQSLRDVPKDAITTVNAPGWNEGGQLTPQNLNDINAGRVFLVIRGVVTYKDIFGYLRKTTSCAYYSPRTGDVLSCPGHNSMK